MISHKHKCIFIHIPKCAGSSILKYFHPKEKLNWQKPNYDIFYGWCPDRKIHLQHATTKQLLETGLVSKEMWHEYFKFTVIRNPWDRSYSDYLWMQKERKVEGSFFDYINKEGVFNEILTNNEVMEYRGDHLMQQTDFIDIEGENKMDAIIRFESLQAEMNGILQKLGLNEKFKIHENKSPLKRRPHYSDFYTESSKNLVDDIYKDDIKSLGYVYENKPNLFFRLNSVLKKFHHK